MADLYMLRGGFHSDVFTQKMHDDDLEKKNIQ
jgi:hypothetical protein